MRLRGTVAASAAAVCVSLAAAALLHRLAPEPAADVARGSEDAFASGLHLRELGGPLRGPRRWTSGRVVVRFRSLPPGLRRVEVRCHSQRGPVTIAAGGAILGVLPPGTERAELALPPAVGGGLSVELYVPTFRAGDGRELGALLDRVGVKHERTLAPPPALALSFAGVALATVLGAAASGLGGGIAVGLAAGLAGLQAALLWPCGLVRSPYAFSLALALLAGVAVSAAFGRWRGWRRPGAAPWAFVALLAAFLVQGVLATAPMLVVSDAVFHANKLVQVAGGDLFPVSQTQHARPFRFPYGVSFYLALAPLVRSGLDPVSLVRAGAAAAGVAFSAVVFALGERASARRAALAVVLLQLLPGVLDIHSYGNLSNVFGQAATAFFLLWWLRPWGGAAAGAALVAVASLAHLSSLIVLAALAVGLAWLWRDSPGRRARLLALAFGALLVGLYYAQLARLLLEQLPRLREGGGSGREALAFWEVLGQQLRAALGQWGWPATLLACLGLPRRWRVEPDRALVALLWAGAALAALAAASPVAVRHLYALTLAVAPAAAWGFERLRARGRAGAVCAWALLLVQIVLASANAREALLFRYRS